MLLVEEEEAVEVELQSLQQPMEGGLALVIGLAFLAKDLHQHLMGRDLESLLQLLQHHMDCNLRHCCNFLFNASS